MLALSGSICFHSVATMDAKKAPLGFRMTASVQALIGCFSANIWLSIFYPWIYWVLTYQYSLVYFYYHVDVDQVLLLMGLRVLDQASDSLYFPFKE